MLKTKPCFTLFLLTIIFLNHSSLYSQVLTTNDRFVGIPQMHNPPGGWYNCDDDSSVDTQPGYFHNHYPAAEGDSYISLVTRILSDGTVETVWAELEIPFLKDRCYKLALDISLSNTFTGQWSFDTYYFDNPCKLQIIGFNDNCEFSQDREILWQSDTLTNYNWETFKMTIKPKLGDYHRIALRASFLDPDQPMNSAILVDYIRLQHTTAQLTPHLNTYKLPEWATNINWYFEGNLIEDEHSHELPLVGNGYYYATFENKEGCMEQLVKYLEVDRNMIVLYPNPTENRATLQYFSAEDKVVTFKIYNDLGKLVKTKSYTNEKGNNKVKFQLGSLAPGLYFISSHDLPIFSEPLKVVVKQ